MDIINSYILVKNITALYPFEATCTMLEEFFNVEIERFGQISNVRMVTNHMVNGRPHSYRAYITYTNTVIHGRVAALFNGKLFLNRELIVRSIRLRGIDSFRQNRGRLNIGPRFRQNTVSAIRILEDSDEEFWEIDEANLADSVPTNEQATLPSLAIAAFRPDQLILDPSSDQETDNITQPANTNQTLASSLLALDNTTLTSAASRVNTDLAQSNRRAFFLCSRCRHDFGEDQINFELHVDICKQNDTDSMSIKFRDALCTICISEFGQCKPADLTILPCGHLLHKDCYRSLLQISNLINKCPICKQNVSIHWTGNLLFNFN